MLAPRLELTVDDTLDIAAHGRVRERLERWLGAWIARRLAPLHALQRASRDSKLGGAGRGIAFRLAEQLGNLRREDAASLLGILTEADRRALGRLGVRFGLHHLYLPELLKPAANEARARLLRVFHGRTIALPPPGRTVLRPATEDLLALGYADFGTFALRVDILERIAARIRAEARAGATFEISPALAAEAGLARGELGLLMEALGFLPATDVGPAAFTRPTVTRRRQGPRRPPATGPVVGSPFEVLARLRVAP